MLDHVGVRELAGRVVQVGQGVLGSHLAVEMDLEAAKLLAFLCVHLVLEIL